MNSRIFCRDVCLDRGEPMVGAGAAAPRYALLHWPRAKWRVPRHLSMGMPESLTEAMLAANVAGINVTLVDGDEIALSCGDEILPRASLPEVAAALERLADGRGLGGRKDRRITILCCTDGKQDPCCAKFGNATWKRLRDLADPSVFRVLQSTHIGGCRFAASLLVLRDRARYGRLDPDQVAHFLAALQRAEVYLPCYRGNPLLTGPAQVAEHAALSHARKTGQAARVVLEEVRIAETEAEFIATLPEARLKIRLTPDTFAVNTRCRTLEDGPDGSVTRWQVAALEAL
ncbi:sucrase ferredoxin [Salipiger thiooxidans]|uniref:sucrase ferredoxin n=1 Tax=Salipiger thiooxidans TaxID=282683 RepID=UPI001CD7F4E1|nr:sucrase ferredoxin [Salipiger thiooxidans]MCA0849788.1 hypothetical protein [Salipiger thiooxidans]